jgi:hypothetical protein
LVIGKDIAASHIFPMPETTVVEMDKMKGQQDARSILPIISS